MTPPPADPFAEAYPALTRWVRSYGWLELGQAAGSRSFIRVLDIGGLVWEGGRGRRGIGAALAEADAAVAKWLAEQVGER
jgi:hypothetical protein